MLLSFTRELQNDPLVALLRISVSTQSHTHPEPAVVFHRSASHGKCLACVCTSMAQQLRTGTEREADGGKILRACWGLTQAALDRPAERVLRNWISCLGLPSEVEYQSGHLKRKLLVKPSARMWLCRRKSRITRHWSHRDTTVVLQYFVKFFPISSRLYFYSTLYTADFKAEMMQWCIFHQTRDIFKVWGKAALKRPRSSFVLIFCIFVKLFWWSLCCSSH